MYAIILLRDGEYPIIPVLHLKRIEMNFHKIGSINILKDDFEVFNKFYIEIKQIYENKNEILPLESVNLQIRSGINTIQGFCELILEEKKINGKITEENVIIYTKMMLDSCEDIIKALQIQLSNTS